MTLVEYLSDLHSIVGDVTSPKLIVAESTLSDAQRRRVVGPEYGHRPYAIVLYRSVALPRRTHDRKMLVTGAIDVTLYHPAKGVEIPDGDDLARLQAEVRLAEGVVNEIRTGYALAGNLQVAVETPVTKDPESDTGGLFAATRFTYPVWR